MSLLSSRFPPHLFYRIQIRGIWRQREVVQLLPNICVLIVLLSPNQSNGLFMPRGIIKYDAVPFAIRARLCIYEISHGLDDRLIIEPGWLSDDQLSSFRDNKAAV